MHYFLNRLPISHSQTHHFPFLQIVLALIKTDVIFGRQNERLRSIQPLGGTL